MSGAGKDSDLSRRCCKCCWGCCCCGGGSGDVTGSAKDSDLSKRSVTVTADGASAVGVRGMWR